MSESLDVGPFIIVQAFVQGDVVNGFRYLDEIGRILGTFAGRFSNRELLPDRVRLHGPTESDDPLVELTASYERYWLHYDHKVTTSRLRQDATATLDKLARITGPEGYSRLGLRLQMLYAIEPAEPSASMVDEMARLVGKMNKHLLRSDVIPWGDIGDLAGLSMTARLKAPSGILVSFSFTPVHRRPPRVTDGAEASANLGSLPDLGLMFDVDLYDERRRDLPETKPFMNNALAILNDRVLPLMNKVVNGAIGESDA